jgi:RHS repeat-associated protein
MNNDLGNRTSATETARQVTYTYDPANQVLSDFLTGPWFFSPTAAVATYSYDPAGNRATTSGFAPGASNVLTTYTNGPGNELTSAVSSASSPTTQTFDLNGNLLTRQIGSAYTTYTWDGENRLLSIAVSPSTAFPTGAIVTNIYDGNGLRQGYRDSTGLTTLTYDGQNIYRRDVQFIGSVQRYTNEPGGYGPLIGQSDTRSGVTSQIYAVSDLSGNIRNWWSSSTRGNLDPYAYEAYGVEWITPAPEPPLSYNVPFFYEGDVGYYQDPTTGLYYVKARWYDPVTGRFISEDPIWFDGGDWNLYRYAENEPVQHIDPSGNSGLDNCEYLFGLLQGNQFMASCGCSNNHPGDQDWSLVLCVLWQETSFGLGNANEGPGNLTKLAFDYLKKYGHCTGLQSYPTFADFKRRASDGEKLWYAQQYLSCEGLARYGPPYSSALQQRLQNCQSCINKTVATQPGDTLCINCCFLAVHS